MRSLILSMLLFTVLISGSCKKSDSLADVFVGRWQLVSTTNGGSTQYPTTDTYMKFNSDGSFSGTAFPGAGTYKVDATAKTLTLSGNATGSFGYSFADNQLNLSLLNALIANNQRYQKVP